MIFALVFQFHIYINLDFFVSDVPKSRYPTHFWGKIAILRRIKIICSKCSKGCHLYIKISQLFRNQILSVKRFFASIFIHEKKEILQLTYMRERQILLLKSGVNSFTRHPVLG